MKKRLLAVLMTAAVATSAFVGCSKGTSSNVEVITELQEPVTIEMWHYMNGKQAETLNEIVEEFNATNGKGITVNAVAQGNIPDLNKKVIAASQSNTLPAIINVYPDIATGLINEGKLLDLAPYMADENVGMADDVKNDFVESFMAELSQWEEGKVYGMPMTKSTEVLYVNKTLLEKLGYTVADMENLTMEKLVEISKKAYDELGIPGFGFDSSSNAFISSLQMKDMNFVDLDGTINVDNEWVREFMTFFQEQTSNGYFRIAGEDKYLSGPFSNQKMLAYQGSSAGFAHINTNGAFEIAVVEVPVFEGKDNAVIQQGASLFATNTVSPQEQYASYEFIKFLTNTENTAKFATSTGYLPVRKSAQDLDMVKALVEDETNLYGQIYKVAQEALEYAYYTPAVNNGSSARTSVEEKYSAFVTNGTANIEDFVKELLTEVETSISRQ